MYLKKNKNCYLNVYSKRANLSRVFSIKLCNFLMFVSQKKKISYVW